MPPIRSDSAPAIGATNIGGERPRQDPQAGVERRVALHGLEELREQEDRAEHPEEHEQRGDVRERERAACGRSASAASARPPAAPRRRTRRRGRPDRRASRRSPGSPSPGRCRGRGPRRSRSRPTLASAEARQVELAGRAVRSRCRRESASGISSEADRHVEPEDPLPREALDDGAADERAEGDREAADPAPGAERDAAPLGGHGGARGSSASAASRSRRRAPARARGDERLDRSARAPRRPSRAVKTPRPIANTRRRPKRSPSAAPVRSSTANVSVYALTVHSRLSSDAPRSSRITGSAVVTTRLSRVDHEERDRGDHERPEGLRPG